MIRRVLLVGVVIVVVFTFLGCHTAEGLKEDVTFIGDKTVEILDKDD